MIKGFFKGCEPRVATPKGDILSTGQVAASRAPLYLAPNKQSMQVSQLLFGEHYRRFACEEHDLGADWHLVQSLRDDYIGYMHCPEICEPFYQGNAKVSKLSTALYSSPNMKSQVLRQLPFGSELYIESVKARNPFSHHEFLYVQALQSWVHKDHVTFNHQAHTDPVALARLFIGQSYQWGGRSGWGCDCSALVQLCYELCGCHLPRDSNLQEKYTPAFDKTRISREQVQAGDLLFWPGHVAIATSSSHLLHATLVGMQVVEEPIDQVCERIFNETKAEMSSIMRPAFLARGQG